MTRWVIIALALIEAGWFIFDGVHALVTGLYLVPASGAHAGQLGPWAYFVRALGVDPLSTPMKLTFVGLGACWLTATGLYWHKSTGARRKVMAAFAFAGIWYAPIGTIMSAIQLVLLARPTSARERSVAGDHT